MHSGYFFSHTLYIRKILDKNQKTSKWTTLGVNLGKANLLYIFFIGRIGHTNKNIGSIIYRSKLALTTKLCQGGGAQNLCGPPTNCQSCIL